MVMKHDQRSSASVDERKALKRTAARRLGATSVLCLALLAAVPPAAALPVERHQLARDPARFDTVAEADALHILSYHDVRADEATLRKSGDRLAVTVTQLAKHFSLLRDLGYNVVSFAQVEAALNGGPALPGRAVLLTFDDGYQSFHRHVLPLLRAFGYPAVLAIVGKWTEDTRARDQGSTGYGDAAEYRPDVLAPLMSWEELADVIASGLVTIASHTYDLHTLHPITPQGDRAPAATTRRWLTESGRPENETEWRTRVSGDLQRNQRLIEERLRVRPRLMVWPYGAENEALRAIAAAVGMPIGLALDGKSNSVTQAMSRSPIRLSRHLVTESTDLATLEAKFLPREIPHRRSLTLTFETPGALAAFVRDEAMQFGPFLERLRALAPSHIRIQLTGEYFSEDRATARTEHLAEAIRLLHRTRLVTGVRIELDVADALGTTGSAAQPVVTAYLRELFSSAFADALVVPAGGAGLALHHTVQRLLPDLERLERVVVSCAILDRPTAATSETSQAQGESLDVLELRWTSVIERGGFALLRIPEAEVRACPKRLAHVLSERANRLPDRFERTQIEFVPVSDDLEASVRWIEQPAKALYAAGFRHFAFGRWHFRPLSDSAERVLTSVFSLRWQPLAP